MNAYHGLAVDRLARVAACAALLWGVRVSEGVPHAPQAFCLAAVLCLVDLASGDTFSGWVSPSARAAREVVRRRHDPGPGPGRHPGDLVVSLPNGAGVALEPPDDASWRSGFRGRVVGVASTPAGPMLLVRPSDSGDDESPWRLGLFPPGAGPAPAGEGEEDEE